MQSITATSVNSGTSNQAFAGGIAGTGNGAVQNCYNATPVSGSGGHIGIGGISGSVTTAFGASMKNCYNYGKITSSAGTNFNGGIVGRNGWGGSYGAIAVNNSYTTTAATNAYCYNSYATPYKTASLVISPDTMKTYTAKMGSAFVYDVYNINDGYPVLAWENERPVMKLDKNQAYIKSGEQIQLNIAQTEEITKIIGGNYSLSNFTWKSTDESVARVNNGIVTGIGDGHATIYAKHESSGMYAMAVINVASVKANPQIETGNGFTVILKADGTVWSIGKNEKGQLGNGTNKNSSVVVQVKTDEDTFLSDIVKIAVRKRICFSTK